MPWLSPPLCQEVLACLCVCADEKVDEMEAETPEHLSELENGDEQQNAADKAGDDTSKQPSPQQAAAEGDAEHPNSSGRQDGHSKEHRSSRHIDVPAADDSVASGTAGFPCMPMIQWLLPQQDLQQ